MNTSNIALRRPLKSSAPTSVNQPSAKQRASLPSTSYTVDQWERDMMEGCKRLNSDEAYRKEVAKRQF